MIPHVSGPMTPLRMSRIAHELDHDSLMDMLLVYSREPRTKLECTYADIIAWEVARRNAPDVPAGIGFTANGERVDEVLDRYEPITLASAHALGLTGDCVQHVGGWECHLRTHKRWPAR
jgi:hypothetical protein